MLAEFRANLVDNLVINQRLAAEPTERDFLVATMRHDVAHHPAGRLGSHGNGLRALLITVEAAGIAASGGQNGVTGDDLGDGRKERNHLADLLAEFPVVMRLRH